MVKRIDLEKIRLICDGVWRDRTAILAARGVLGGEAALTRAVYWRLCKEGRKPGESIEDCAHYLRDIVRRYRAESRAGLSGAAVIESEATDEREE